METTPLSSQPKCILPKYLLEKKWIKTEWNKLLLENVNKCYKIIIKISVTCGRNPFVFFPNTVHTNRYFSNLGPKVHKIEFLFSIVILKPSNLGVSVTTTQNDLWDGNVHFYFLRPKLYQKAGILLKMVHSSLWMESHCVGKITLIHTDEPQSHF